MNRKLFSFASVLVAAFSIVVAGASADAQSFGNYGQSNGQCDCQSGQSCSAKVWRCLYGQMVGDGTGGAFRIYGYPTPPCCGNAPYPVWGMGGACLNGCPPSRHYRCPPRAGDGFQAGKSGRTLSSPNHVAVMAYCVPAPTPCCSSQPAFYTVQMPKSASKTPMPLPANLELASSPTPIRFVN